jgi:hypothetical protein
MCCHILKKQKLYVWEKKMHHMLMSRLLNSTPLSNNRTSSWLSSHVLYIVFMGVSFSFVFFCLFSFISSLLHFYSLFYHTSHIWANKTKKKIARDTEITQHTHVCISPLFSSFFFLYMPFVAFRSSHLFYDYISLIFYQNHLLCFPFHLVKHMCIYVVCKFNPPPVLLCAIFDTSHLWAIHTKNSLYTYMHYPHTHYLLSCAFTVYYSYIPLDRRS